MHTTRAKYERTIKLVNEYYAAHRKHTTHTIAANLHKQNPARPRIRRNWQCVTQHKHAQHEQSLQQQDTHFTQAQLIFTSEHAVQAERGPLSGITAQEASCVHAAAFCSLLFHVRCYDLDFAWSSPTKVEQIGEKKFIHFQQSIIKVPPL